MINSQNIQKKTKGSLCVPGLVHQITKQSNNHGQTNIAQKYKIYTVPKTKLLDLSENFKIS